VRTADERLQRTDDRVKQEGKITNEIVSRRDAENVKKTDTDFHR